MIRLETQMPECSSVESLLAHARGRIEALVENPAEWEVAEADLARTKRPGNLPPRVKGRVVFVKKAKSTRKRPPA